MKISNMDILEHVSEMVNRVDENMSKWNYVFEEEKYKNRTAVFTILNSVKVLRKCFGGMNVEIPTQISAKGCYIIIYDHTVFLSIEKSEDILLAGPSIANNFLLDILKDDIKFKRKLKLKKINNL